MWFYPKSTKKKAFFSFCKIKRIVKGVFPPVPLMPSLSVPSSAAEHTCCTTKLRAPPLPRHAWRVCQGPALRVGVHAEPRAPWGDRASLRRRGEHRGGVARAAAASLQGGGMVDVSRFIWATSPGSSLTQRNKNIYYPETKQMILVKKYYFGYAGREWTILVQVHISCAPGPNYHLIYYLLQFSIVSIQRTGESDIRKRATRLEINIRALTFKAFWISATFLVLIP